MHKMMKFVAAVLIAAVATWITAGPSAAGNWRSGTVSETRDTVVLLHGLGRGKAAMWMLGRRLSKAGYRIKLVGYRSTRRTPEQILKTVREEIADCCAGRPGKIHFVGHSLGGLIVRAFLARNDVANLGRVVLVGTPNHGTALVDHYRDEWWFKLLGPTAPSLGTQKGNLAESLPKPDYPVGVIAGKADRGPNEHVLPGADDGLVSVASARLDGMTDFIVVPSSHWAMRYRPSVVRQIVSFLETGRFEK